MANRRRNTRRSSSNRVWVLALVVSVVVLAVGIVMASRHCSHNERTVLTRQVPVEAKVTTPALELLTVNYSDKIPAQVKEYEGFTVNFNASNRTPNYVVWELTADHSDGPFSRNGISFWQDDDIKNCPETSDYTRSGYDRGHMFPAADGKWSDKVMEASFCMANITPQMHALNAGAWKTLEDKERQWARRDGRLIIVAGPVYQSDDKLRIGEAGVRVPSGFFKVLLAPDVAEPRAIGFVYPNQQAPGNMSNYSQTVDYVEQLTGFDFFPALPDDVEQRLEAEYSFKAWNRR